MSNSDKLSIVTLGASISVASKKIQSALTGIATVTTDNVNKTITMTFNDSSVSVIQFEQPTGIDFESTKVHGTNQITITDGSHSETIDVLDGNSITDTDIDMVESSSTYGHLFIEITNPDGSVVEHDLGNVLGKDGDSGTYIGEIEDCPDNANICVNFNETQTIEIMPIIKSTTPPTDKLAIWIEEE